MNKNVSYLLVSALAVLALAGCATNPVTGEDDLMFYSEEEEIRIGVKEYVSTRQQSGGDYLVDPELEAYIAGVMKRIARVSDRKLPYELKICNDPSFNAWALPAGKFCINRGAIAAIETEGELAALLGHEMVHATARHTVRKLSKSRSVDIGVAVLAIAASTRSQTAGNMVHAFGGVGGSLATSKFTRDHEREADYYGMIYMKRAGYDPREMISMQKKLKAASGGGKRKFSYFDTHPMSDERITNAIRLAQEIGAGGEVGRERYQKMTTRFRERQKYYDDVERVAPALVKKGDVDRAKQLIDNAIAAVPAEASFLTAKADLARHLGLHDVAMNYYGKSLKKNPDFFYPYLMLSAYLHDTRQYRLAEQYARQSWSLYPTKQSQELIYALSQ